MTCLSLDDLTKDVNLPSEDQVSEENFSEHTNIVKSFARSPVALQKRVPAFKWVPSAVLQDI